MKINTLPFSKVLADSTKKYTKIKKENYLENGKYAIVDQGKDFICGYTNKEDVVNFEDFPLIVFGDHTKIFKYINFPIAIGADGVKALTVDSNIADTKYVYYYLKSLKLHNAGYARHFKYLKVKNIALPKDKNNQIKIANLLTQVEELISKRKESIKLLDKLLESTFLDMFGDPVNNSKKFEETQLQDVCRSKGEYGSGASAIDYDVLLPRYLRITDINYDGSLINEKKSPDKVESKYFLEYGDILFARTGATVGKTYLYTSDEQLQFAGYLIRFKPDFELVNPFYLFHFTQSGYYTYWVSKKQRAAGQPNINAKEYGTLKLLKPPKPLQDKFATIVQQVEATKAHYHDSLDELNELFGSLSQKAFRGELDLNGMEVEEEVLEGASDFLETSTKQAKNKVGIFKQSTPTILFSSHTKIVNKLGFFQSLKAFSEKSAERKEHIYQMLEDIPQIKKALDEGILCEDDFLSLPLRMDYSYANIKTIIMDKLISKELTQHFDEKSKSIKLVKVT